MTPIERVRAVLTAGTPGPWFQSCSPWQPDGRFVYAGSPDPHQAPIVADCDPDLDIPDLDAGERDDNARKLALAVNLAPAFVALWEADVALDAAESMKWNDPKAGTAHADANRQRREALAALNEAAAREVEE